MKRKYKYKQKFQLSEEITVTKQIKIMYKPKRKIMKEEESKIINEEELKQLTPIQKGTLLETKTKEIIEANGFTVTITKAHNWEDGKLKILGDNGIDGIFRKKIQGTNYNRIIQYKCYASTSTISTNVVIQLDYNINFWKNG